MSDLPQPIYPTPGQGSGSGSGSVPPPPSGGPPEAPTWTVGPPGGTGGPPGQGPKLNPQLIAGIAVAVLVVIGVVVFAVSQSGKSDGPSTSGNTSGTTVPNGNGPGSSSQEGPGPSAGGSGDVTARAQDVASQTFLAAQVAPATVSCIADALAASPDLLATVEPVASSVVLESPDDASRYAELVMGCAAPQDLTNEIVQGLGNSGQFDQSALVCIDSALSGYSTGDWVEFLTAAVQTARANEVQSVLSDAITYC